jgi:beta-glucan synthesis-associated protein KRE6
VILNVHCCRYIDDKFIYGIDGLALNVSGATIPLEPMYLILNTAMSSTWGFPDSKDCPRPRDGSPSCYDCRDPQCQCYIPKGLCGNLPANFLIDYIRVYQDLDKGSRHTTGKSMLLWLLWLLFY